jgi:FtsH-binding integral membrane protein
MSKFDNFQPAVSRTRDVHEGLRGYMMSVYNYMTMGLGLTGLVAYLVSSNPQLSQLFLGTPLVWLFMLAPIGIVFFLGARIHKMSFATAQATFWMYAALMGVSMASIFLMYTGQSVARVFFITAATFGATSLYGYTTKKDLSGFGSFLFMGLIGIIIASIVNIFLKSSALQFAVSVIGVLVFTGLTAYDTQRIREMYEETLDGESLGKMALMGALSLYLDFINLFVMLMRLIGDRR